MKKLLTASLLAAFTMSPAFAVTAEDLTDEVKMKITEMLKAQGYEVVNFDVEENLFDVNTVKDGKNYELFLNDNLEVVDVKKDD